MEPQIFNKDVFTYEADFAALANGASATQTIQIDSSSDFMWQKSCFFADIAAAVQTDSSRVIPLATILITDTGSSRQLMNAAVPLASLFGYGASPFILSQPKIYAARTSISVTLANFSAATTYNIRLSFIGVKLFR